MSKIQKLSILGIRSFDNTRSETIQFYSPLTLIVGYNGSGKTTIIECLKYATTGDQPPNSKGGAFVHDPSICGEKEVLAQVKLSFRSTSDAHMVITRSLQLSVKKATRSLKTLEGQLLMLKDGDRIAISSRVAELDQIMPQYLGVSKAILDNVVFCHQDESLWPLSEPSVLKKKFDEIFEALKYTKAIENIKVLKKKQNEELGKLKLTEQHEKENKDRGEKAEKRSVLLRDEIQKLRSDAENLNSKADESQRKANEAFDNASHYERIVVELSGKRMQANNKEESINELKGDIQEMQDSDQDLKSMLEQYDERTALCSQEIESKTQQYSALAQELKAKREELGTKQRDQGQYEGEKTQYEHQLQERETIVKDTARQHNIRGFDYDLNDSRIRDFMERITKISRDQSSVIERAREESQKELADAQMTLNHLNERKATLSQSKEHAKSQMTANERKLADQDRALQSIQVDEGAKANLESSVKNLHQNLQSLKSKAEGADWDQNIRLAEEEIRTLDEQKEKLEAEMLDATRRAQETAQIDHLRRTLKENETGLETMKGAHGTRLTQLIGSSWQASPDVEVDYQAAMDSKLAQVKEAQTRADQLGFQLSQINYKIANNKQDTKTKLEKKNQYEKDIKDATGEEDVLEYHSALQSTEEQVETRKKDLVFSKWYADVKNTLDEHNCCRLCRRTFSGQTDRNDFKAIIRKYTDEINANEVAEDLEQAEQDLRTLRNVSTTFDNWRALTQTEIPSIKRELIKLEAEQKQIASQSEKADQDVKDLEAGKRELDVISQNVKRMAKYQNDIKTCQQQIEGLLQKPTATSMSRGTEAINDDQKKVGERYRMARKKLDSIREDRDGSRNQIGKLEIEVRDANEKLQSTIGQLKERDAINRQREEIIRSVKEQRDQISDADEKLQQLSPQISQCQTRYDDIQRRGDEHQKQLQAEATKITASLDQLKHAQSVIQSYIDRDGPKQLARVEKEIQANLDEQQQIEVKQRDMTKEINALKQQTEHQAETKRSIERNLKYRRDQSALKQLREEITELESHHAEADRERYMAEGKSCENERIRLSAEAASILGEAKSKDVELKRILDDWNTDYKDAAFKHREANIKVQATKAAVEDLTRYGGALDKAIMKYHSLKMDEINAVIEELWRKTYQGTDIDTILIRSDNDNVKGNKSYNYRVCMVKQDAEMDMRGRCSAGQKVLASIIIRLALAECFGVSCGLIALDEPTTNLDRDNIRSLAMALHDIIKVRQQQSNFQLIVITHDEEFLRFMRCQDFCDYYYRISRNEKQKSQIERQSLAEVM